MATHHHLKAIAAFRALRGVVIGTTAVAIYAQADENLDSKAEQLLTRMDVDVTHTVAGLLSQVLDARGEWLMDQIVLVCLAWSALLFVQAYGLWQNRHWAVWLAFATSVFVLTGFAWVALPIFGTKATLIVAGNLLVATYLLYLLRRKRGVAE